MRKPFYKPNRRRWYAEIHGKQRTLSKEPCDKVDQVAKEAAEQKYHELMASRQSPGGGRKHEGQLTVHEVVAQFLKWTKANREDSTHEWYFKHLVKPGDFGGFIGKKLTVEELTPFHITNWLEKKYKDTGDTYRAGACRAVARCFNWAVKMRLISSSPVQGMDRPQAQPRETYISPEEWETLAALVSADNPFHDLVWFLRLTGCRPQEARLITAAHWDRKRTLTLERKNSKGKKRKRVIWLNNRAAEIVARLAMKLPTGELFLTAEGKPWHRFRMADEFVIIAKKSKIAVTAYTLRHSWITDALTRGVDPVTVAKMAGHTDLTMITRVYGHIEVRPDYMTAQIQKATGEVA